MFLLVLSGSALVFLDQIRLLKTKHQMVLRHSAVSIAADKGEKKQTLIRQTITVMPEQSSVCVAQDYNTSQWQQRSTHWQHHNTS